MKASYVLVGITAFGWALLTIAFLSGLHPVIYIIGIVLAYAIGYATSDRVMYHEHLRGISQSVTTEKLEPLLRKILHEEAKKIFTELIRIDSLQRQETHHIN